MALTLTTPNTVLGVLSPKSQSARLVANLATVVLGSLLLALSAKISVPVSPVAVTLTSMTVALLAAGFGWRIGVATVALYIVQGLAGLPFFASPPYGGISYLLSPSFGFIIGYLPMAYIIGRATDLGASGRPALLFLAMLVGDAVLFAFGFTWLLVAANIITQSGAALPKWLDAGNLIGTAWNGAIAPFVLWDVLKMAFAALSIVGIWKLMPKKADGQADKQA